MDFRNHLTKDFSPWLLCAFRFNKLFYDFNVFSLGKFRQLRKLGFDTHNLPLFIFGAFASIQKVFLVVHVIDWLKIGTNRLLQNWKVQMDFSEPWRFAASRLAGRGDAEGRSPEATSSKNLTCLEWSRILNLARTHFEKNS